MEINQEYERWLVNAADDPDLIPELKAISGKSDEIADRFAVELEFGTAGLRGVIGAGTNRMNLYIVRKATQGLANYILRTDGPHRVAISYDSRIKSELFSHAAAEVLAANGITACIYPHLMPVPALSFATRYLHCDAGIMVTASHNPAKYNGYKAYGPDGCQMTSQAADAVYAEMQATDTFAGVKVIRFEEGLRTGLIQWIGEEVEQELYRNIEAQSVRPEVFARAGLKLVYSPLNGSGNLPVRHVLADMGIQNITVVPEQEMPDGNFPTCPYPNPEIREALAKGLELSEKISADLMLATDPDADRVGIAVRLADGSYKLLTGNEVGVLLLDYLCTARLEKGTLPADPVMVKSIVSTVMADVVARYYGVQPIHVLTGFKYIGEQIHLLEEKNQQNRYLLGFEESYGYLCGSYVRDKDAIVASMLIVEMASWYVSQGSSLYRRLTELYAQFGWYLNRVESFEFDGLSGMGQMKKIMSELRSQPPKQIGGLTVQVITDLTDGSVTNLLTGEHTRIELPSANVLIWKLEQDAQVIVRPSGTEPKIKVYYSTKGCSAQESAATQKLLAADMQQTMKQ